MAAEMVGSIMLIGVMMTGAAMVAAQVLSTPPPETVPAFNYWAARENSTTLRLHHLGGDPIPADRYRIFIGGENVTARIRNPGPFTMGRDLWIDNVPETGGTVALAFSGDGQCWRIVATGVR